MYTHQRARKEYNRRCDMFSFVYNTNRDYDRESYDIKKAAEHISKTTSERDKDKK
jgi:hypothetical protein